MSDVLLALGRRPTARKVAKVLGLPVPLPQDLDRDNTLWKERSLQGKTVLLSGDSRNLNTIQQDLAAAGAQVQRDGLEGRTHTGAPSGTIMGTCAFGSLLLICTVETAQ